MASPLTTQRTILDALQEVESSLSDKGNGDEDPGVVIFRMGNPQAYYVASAVIALDRELRRVAKGMQFSEFPLETAVAAQFNTAEGSVARAARRGHYPLVPGRASLNVIAAEEGSSVLLLEPAGIAVTLLTSVPLTVLLNMLASYGYTKSLAIWVKDKAWPGVGKRAGRSDLDAVREAGDAGPGALIGSEQIGVEFPNPNGQMTAEGVTINGPAEVTYIRRHADGSSTVVQAKLGG